MKMPQDYIEDRYRDHPLTMRTHLAEQTGAPHNMHKRIMLWAHLSACQMKIRSREAHLGSADPIIRPNLDKHLSRCISRRSSYQGT